MILGYCGRVVYARRHAVGDQVEQESVFACWRGLDQLDHIGRLLGGQGQRRDAERGTLSNMLAVGLQHRESSCGAVDNQVKRNPGHRARALQRTAVDYG